MDPSSKEFPDEPNLSSCDVGVSDAMFVSRPASAQQTLSSEYTEDKTAQAGPSGVIKRINTFSFGWQNRRKHSSKGMVDANNGNDRHSESTEGKKSHLWVNLLMKFKKRQLNESGEIADANPSATCICTGYKRKTDGEQVMINPVSDSGTLTRCPSPGTNPTADNSGSRSGFCSFRSRSLNSDAEIGNGVQLTPYPSLSVFKSISQALGLSAEDALSTHIHSQVDYVHRLVPDLWQISCCSFYWGVIDRYEAEKVLENKPEGTFLLRDSAQDDFLFSVSFRRYGRSLHARIEHSNQEFSFDCTDRESFSSATICGLIEHYKDPSACMFFEPTLCTPLSRAAPFSLQHLARAKACVMVTYDQVAALPLPRSLKSYLKEYHYKQRVRVRKLDDHGYDDDSGAAVGGASCGGDGPRCATLDVAGSAESGRGSSI